MADSRGIELGFNIFQGTSSLSQEQLYQRLFIILESFKTGDCVGAAEAVARSGLMEANETQESLTKLFQEILDDDVEGIFKTYVSGSGQPPEIMYDPTIPNNEFKESISEKMDETAIESFIPASPKSNVMQYVTLGFAQSPTQRQLPLVAETSPQLDNERMTMGPR